MNIGIAIDVQRGFLDSNTETRELEGRITSLVNRAPFDVLFATKFVNGKNSPYQKLLGWTAMQGSPETDLLPIVKDRASQVIEKGTYTPPEQLFDALPDGTDTVYLFGLDTDACILAAAMCCMDHGIRPVILAHYCASSIGPKYHRLALTFLTQICGEEQVIPGEIRL